ncbi:FYVE zinc finger-domain-containing protein [Chlamydoabsidia padenii]|nr:FYVE zinc finger-domain-containing protein [Chlamydoabsidia padenii]
MVLGWMYEVKWVILLLVSGYICIYKYNSIKHYLFSIVNAASKGYISIVEYLLDEAHANPLLKNHIGEAAYDASAASREAYICEILEKAGKKWWHTQQMEGTNNNNNNPSSTRNSQYDVLDYHVTVMVVLHENQRATSLLGLSRPQFNASYLTKQDVRGPWSLHPSGTPSSKDQVEPPRQKNDTGRANWFWITDWQIDLSDPRIDPTSGWQYARSFEENDEAWTPVAPTGGNGWVRRRRWVRVMNRQMDFASNHRHLGNNGYDLNISQDDYLATAEDMVQSFPMDISDLNDDDSNRTVGQRIQALTKELRAYEESVQLLLAGVKDDLNQYRKERANNLIKIHSTKIDKLNGQIATLAPQLATPISPAPLEHNAELARELGFISNDYQNNRSDHDDNDRYPNKANGNDFDANPWTRDTIGSDRTSFQPRSLQRLDDGDNNSTSGSSLMHQVEFDNNNNNNNNSSPYEAGSVRGFEWESDINAKDCRRCNRRFGLLNRRHHCRRCGLIVCDRCSASRAYLPASQILQNPNGPLEPSHVLESHHQRICDKCYADLGINA